MTYLTWKGTASDYKILHRQISKLFGKQQKCIECGDEKSNRYEWANISGEYRLERSDWKRLCITCHRRLDSLSYVGKRFAGKKHTTKSRAKTQQSMRQYWLENREKMESVHAKASRAKRENNLQRRSNVKNVPVLQIDTAVPLPSDSRPTRQQIPVHRLAVGESILFPSQKRQAVANIVTRLKQNEGKVFVVKKMDDKHHRVWRIE